MHGGELGHGGFGDVDVETLTLIDEGSPRYGQVNDGLLADFPNGLVEHL